MALFIERDDHDFYVIDATRLGRVADLYTKHRANARQLATILDVGPLPKGWTITNDGRTHRLNTAEGMLKATIWEIDQTFYGRQA